MRSFIVISLLIMLISSVQSLKIDFGLNKDGEDWYIVNDGVMGGLSQSNARLIEGSILFKGNTSLKNNGGFASVRGPLNNYDLSQFNKVRIRYKSINSREFSLSLALSDLYYRPNYKVNIKAPSDSWQTIQIALTDFKEYTLGRVSDKKIGPANFSDIIRFVIIVSDKKEGPFEIEIDYIEFI